MPYYLNPKLVNFYLFNNSYGQKEGEEHEKLLYYYPASDDLNTQIRCIGLSEAFTRFTGMFNKTDDCETVLTQKHCTVMLQPEPNIWMVMKVALSRKCDNKDDDKKKKSRLKSNKTENNSPVSKTKNSPKTGRESSRTSSDNVSQQLNDSAATDSTSADSNKSDITHNDITDSVSQEDNAINISCRSDAIDESEEYEDASSSVSRHELAESSSSSGSSNRATNVDDAPAPDMSEDLASKAGSCKYLSNSVQSNVLKAHLRAAYSAFAFLHHSYGVALEQLGLVKLRGLLQAFYDDYLQRCDVSGGGIPEVWGGLSFLPLCQSEFLRVYCCLAALRSSLPSLQYTGFVYAGSVVWCDFDSECLRRLMYYLSYTGVFRDPGQSRSFIGGVGHSTRVFMTDSSCSGGADSRRECQLIVYTCGSALLPLVVPGADKLSKSFFDRLNRTLCLARVAQLCSELNPDSKGSGSGGKAGSKPSSDAGSFKYMYHNAMNLATKSTVRVDPADADWSEDAANGDSGKSSHGWWFKQSNSSTANTATNNTSLSAASANDGRGSSTSINTLGLVGGSAFGVGSDATVANTAPTEIISRSTMHTVVDMHADITKYGWSECVVKTVDDEWVVGKTGNSRQLFVTMHHTSANLVEITDEVQRLCSADFGNILMTE